MERTYQNIEIVDICDTRFDRASQNAVAKAGESLRQIDWFAVAEQSSILSRLLTDQRGRLNGTNL